MHCCCINCADGGSFSWFDVARQVDNQVDPVSFLLGVLICKCIWIFCPNEVLRCWGDLVAALGWGFFATVAAGFVAGAFFGGMVESSSYSSSSSSMGGVSSSPGALLLLLSTPSSSIQC